MAIFTDDLGGPQTAKELPQPQDAVAFGLLTRKIGAGQVLDVVELAADQVHQRHTVDHHLGAVPLDRDVAVLVVVVEREVVLKSRAAAARDADAQPQAGLALAGEDLADPPRGPLAHA